MRLIALLALAACQSSTAPPPKTPAPAAGKEPAEASAEHESRLGLPDVPEFELPPAAKGSHSVKQLRIDGQKLFGTKVEVEGYVVWLYDCAADLASRGESPDEVQRLLRDEPERCSRPSFYLGEQSDAARERSLWVVDVPRAPRPDELQTLPKNVLAEWPEVPEIAVGDRVIVTGTWDNRSPGGFINSQGLLSYESLTHVR